MALFQILKFATVGPIAATPVTDGPLAEAPLGDKSGAPVINAGNSLALVSLILLLADGIGSGLDCVQQK
ncbi:hypothetical protein Peur_056651 [Populus x canadensis]|jgi:hypothetical protein